MRRTNATNEDQSEPGSYEIRIRGHLDQHWAAWFEGLTITLDDNGETLLTGRMIDQAGLFGLLKKVRDLGLPLISVSQVQTQETQSFRLNKEKNENDQ